MDMYKGATVIAIEGGEGTGKGTLINNLKKEFPDASYIFEPGFGSQKGAMIRDLIMKKERSEAELIILFALARNEIQNGVQNGTQLIFTDRSILTSLVYQTTKHTYEDVLSVNRECVDGFRLPDACILLTGDVSAIQQRLHQSDRSTNWLDHKPLSYHRNVDRQYHRVIDYFYNEDNRLILDNTDLRYSTDPSYVVNWIRSYLEK